MVGLVDAVHPDHGTVRTNAHTPLGLVKGPALGAKAILVVIVQLAAVITPHSLHSPAPPLFIVFYHKANRKVNPSAFFSQQASIKAKSPLQRA